MGQGKLRNAMRVLFVTPSEVSTGEAITALHIAGMIQDRGGQAHFLASSFTAQFVESSQTASVTGLTEDPDRNRDLWTGLLAHFQPEAILFADYPLLFFEKGPPSLADDGWVERLEALDIPLLTLDHLGYAQRSFSLFFGPPHLSFQAVTLQEIPESMQILLPCPSHAPESVPERRGVAFRYWDGALELPERQRQEIRQRYLAAPDDLLIFHSVPTWAQKYTRLFGLPYYDYLPDLLETYLQDLPRPVTVISVNDGTLLAPIEKPGLRIRNLSAISKTEYEALLLASDLMLTENQVSNSLGKAVCGRVPCVVLANSYRLLEILDRADDRLRRILLAMEGKRLGAIFPYEVFPIWGQRELDQLGLFNSNPLVDGFARLEAYGGEATRQRLQGLLLDPVERAHLRRGQQAYIDGLAHLPDAAEVLQAVMVGSHARRKEELL